MFMIARNTDISADGRMSCRGRRGFTLIEVLVALLILCIGVLGIVALQFKGLKYSHDANLRSQVNFLAYDISDRMRLNRANVADYVNDYVAGTSHTACAYATASADNDLNCWHDQVDLALPAGSLANIAGPDGNLYTVALTWNDREGEPHSVNYTIQP